MPNAYNVIFSFWHFIVMIMLMYIPGKIFKNLFISND